MPNTKKVRKFIVLGFGLVICILILRYVFVMYIFSSSLSQQQQVNIIKMVESPDKKYTAYVFEKNNGATQWFTYRLTILEKGKEFTDFSGNCLRTYGEFDVEWIDNTTLIIYFTSEKEITMQKNKVKGVNIEYKYLNNY